MSPRIRERLLVINPGSTGTKVAVFDGEEPSVEVQLPVREAGDLWGAFPARLEGILYWLEEVGVPLGSLEGVVGRGGLLRPMAGGTYRVSDAMLADARSNLQGTHASNLGCALARAVAEAAGPSVGAFVVDPVSTDEFDPLARYSGLKQIRRKSLSHALSIHALVREVCRQEGRSVDGSAFVVAHLGGGISVCPVRGGRILDANNANSGGPFSPSRAGGLPTQELLELVFSPGQTLERLQAMTLREGGLVSYLGTQDAREVEARIADGDGEARAVFEAMAYQIAKEIAAMAAVLAGRVDAVLITGGLAASELLTGWVKERVAFLGPVRVVPEVEEMRALATGGLRVLRGEEEAKEYQTATRQGAEP